MIDPGFRYAHLHGLSSGSRSRKGLWLAARFAAAGVPLALPELNVPSFAQLTLSGALAVLDDLDQPARAARSRWRLSGSSMGGYLAALWAAANPDRVERLVLLCPAFGLGDGLARRLGPDAVTRWRQEGSLSLAGPDGQPASLHHQFLEDARRHPPFPMVCCPTLILHGLQDDVVPLQSSREYAATDPRVRLVELPDDHLLLRSLPRIGEELEGFYAGSE